MHSVVLTIGGSDSSGGAGVQRDIKTFESIGVYGASCLTALTAQNTMGIRNILPIPISFIKEQIDTVFDDMKVSAVKTGMLYDKSIILTVVERLKFHKPDYIVVDPVMVSGTGYSLLENGAVSEMLESLFPIATISTPNRMEASLLSGIEIDGIEDAEKAAKKIFRFCKKPVLIKGGHLVEKKAVDVLFDGERVRHFSGERLDVQVHGAGCCYASGIASYLALGNNLLSSIEKAKRFVSNCIENAGHYGKGSLVW
ncbi:bifunctional hydroxymethylpyrimidine kinase/phosphomethylpyrimidine kinase [candidate division WOR-3 bacterium]|nr:bifunctional hydroxymethylpyrimidine kinase/phosphomethylpyrimidine kinase [candidate division WOR-3 bacterium]